MLLLAGGYATRLRPLTDRLAKPLLPVGGKPMIDWIVDRIVAAEIADELHLVTNAVYASDFERWAAVRDVTVWNDGTSSNDDRLGAIGDVRFAVEQGGLGDDDLLVIAADNLFEFSLRDYVSFWEGKGTGSAIAVHRLADPSLASLYGVVELDQDDRVIGMEEKPEHPRRSRFDRHLPLASRPPADPRRYLDDGNPPDPQTLLWRLYLHDRLPTSTEPYSTSVIRNSCSKPTTHRERSGCFARAHYSL